MRNAFMEAKCNARNFKLPEEIGLRLPRKTFAAFTYTENMGDISKDGLLGGSAPPNCIVPTKICFKHIIKTKSCPPKMYFAPPNLKTWLRCVIQHM